MQDTQSCIDDADVKVEERESPDRPALGTPSAIPHAGNDESSLVSEVLQRIWQDSLRVPHVNPGDDFFDLGGDSLTAIRMLTCIDREYGEELLEPDIIYKASRFGDFTNAVMDALAQRAPGK